MALLLFVVFYTAIQSSVALQNSLCAKDVLIVVDTSFSIGKTNADFSKEVLPFITAVIKHKKLNVKSGGTNIAMTTFSSPGKTKPDHIKFGEVKEVKTLDEIINKKTDYKKLASGGKNTADALKKVYDQILGKRNPTNARPANSDVILLVTDGVVGKAGKKSAVKNAKTLKDNGIKIVGALVGSKKKMKVLQSLVSSQNYAFDVGAGSRDTVVDNVVNKLCLVDPNTPKPPTVPKPKPAPVPPPPPAKPVPVKPVPVKPSPSKTGSPKLFLPTLSKFLKSPTPLVGDFKITDKCTATAKKTGGLFQISSTPPYCMTLASLFKLFLPKDKGNFDMGSTGFMTMEKIIIRSLCLSTVTKGVAIAATYIDPINLIPGVISISNVRMQIAFISTQSYKWTFDISASITIGTLTIAVKIVRNEEGYYLSASSNVQITATSISQLFQTSDSFLPTAFKDKLKKAKLDSFAIQKPRFRAAFSEGYGFLFGGQVRILDWELFDVNLLINKPNDSPTSVTIAIYTPSFSIPKVFKDLFGMDVSNVPIIGSAVVRNLALTISTADVEMPLTVLDIGSQELFNVPYPKGLKASFEINIADIYVTVIILISPTKISLTVYQPGKLTLGKVMSSFLPTVSVTDKNKKFPGWPSFINVDPLSISVTYLDIAATKVQKKWGMSNLKISLKMTKPISFFNGKITIADLAFDMNWDKVQKLSGLISGTVFIGSVGKASPKVNIRIPFPLKNQALTFRFTNFNIHQVATAFGVNLPTDFPKLLAQIKLDLISVGFSDAGKVNKVIVQASIPQMWPIFGSFSIGNVKIAFEYDNSASGKKSWALSLSGNIVVSSCTISVSAIFGTDFVKIDASGKTCSASVGDLLAKIKINPDSLPNLITGFTLSEPKLSFMWNRKNTKSKSIRFSATTSLFGNSKVEVGLVRSGDKSGVVAAFAVNTASSVSAISFISSLGLKDLAVIYVSQNMALAPFTWGNRIFNKYVNEGGQTVSGLTIYASLVPDESNFLGKLLKKAGQKSIEVKLSLPNLVFELKIPISSGVGLAKTKGTFTSMTLVISKSLIGLRLEFTVSLDNKPLLFKGELKLTFGGTVSISLLMVGEWNEPFGIKNFKIHRLGLALGINLVSLIPTFGLTGAITVTPPGLSKLDASITLCVDPSNPSTIVIEIHFTRLLLQDIVNTFANKNLNLPKQIGEMGFPDEVQIYVSPAGNDDCFGKKYPAGVEIHGTFQIPFLNILARADVSIGLKKFSLKADLRMNPINYAGGLLKIVSAESDRVGPFLKLNIGNSLDEFLIDGSCKVVIFGASISIRLTINKEKLFFQGQLNLWNLFRVTLTVELTYTKSNPGLKVIGEMHNDLFAKIKQRAIEGIRNGARAINRKISAAQQKITNAQREVDGLLGTIRYHQRKIREARHDCSRAPWYKKYICIGTGFRILYHGTIIAGVWIARNVAIGVLEIAKLFLEGVKGLIKVGAAVLSALVNAALSIIDIQYIRFDLILNGQTRVFKFQSRIVILSWKFTPSFQIDFSSSYSANKGINGVGDSVSQQTVKKL